MAQGQAIPTAIVDMGEGQRSEGVHQGEVSTVIVWKCPNCGHSFQPTKPVPTPDPTAREAFEKWYERNRGVFISSQKEACRCAWQAALSSQPQPVATDAPTLDQCEGEFWRAEPVQGSVGAVRDFLLSWHNARTAELERRLKDAETSLDLSDKHMKHLGRILDEAHVSLDAASAPRGEPTDQEHVMRSLELPERIAWLHTEKGLADARLRAVEKVYKETLQKAEQERDEALTQLDKISHALASTGFMETEGSTLGMVHSICDLAKDRVKLADKKVAELSAAQARIAELKSEAAEWGRRNAEIWDERVQFKAECDSLRSRLSQSPWIACKDRMPTKEDALHVEGWTDSIVLWWGDDYYTGGITMGDFKHPGGAKYWASIPPLPSSPQPEVTPATESGEKDGWAEAPFTPKQVVNLVKWQEAGYVHPLTCRHCNDRNGLLPTERGLVCMSCDAIQTRVPAMCVDGPGPNPLELFKASHPLESSPDPLADVKEAHKAGKRVQVRMKKEYQHSLSDSAWQTYEGDTPNFTNPHWEWRIHPDEANPSPERVALGPDVPIPGDQFTVRLSSIDGQMQNYFAHGAFERQLKTARLLERFQFGDSQCTLLFERLPESPASKEARP